MIVLLAAASLLLLADAEAGVPTWIAPAMSVIAAAVAGYFARSSQRDKLAFDAELAKLRADNARTRLRLGKAIKKLARMESSLIACHAERKSAMDERDVLRKEVAELRETCDRQQEEIDTQAEAGRNRQREIEELKAIAGSKHD